MTLHFTDVIWVYNVCQYTQIWFDSLKWLILSQLHFDIVFRLVFGYHDCNYFVLYVLHYLICIFDVVIWF